MDFIDHLEKFQEAFSSFEPVLEDQLSFIQKIASRHLPKEEYLLTDGESHNRNSLFNKLITMLKDEIIDLIDIAKKCLDTPLKKVPHDDHTTDNFWINQKQIIDMLSTDYNKYIENSQEKQRIESLVKMFLYREELMSQIMMSIIYQKMVKENENTLLWTDANFPVPEYVHKVVDQLLIDFQKKNEKHMPIPPRLTYKEFIKVENGKAIELSIQKLTSSLKFDCTNYLTVLQQSYHEMEKIILNVFDLKKCMTPDAFNTKMNTINPNDNRVQTLRDQIEILQKTNQELETKFRNLKEATEYTDAMGIRRLQEKCLEYEVKINEIITENSKKGQNIAIQQSEYVIKLLEQKNEEIEKENKLLKTQILSCFKEIGKFQKEVIDEFVRIKREFDVFPGIFKKESNVKMMIQKEADHLKITIDKLVSMLGEEKKKNNNLKKELLMKEQVYLEVTSKYINERNEKNDAIEQNQQLLKNKENLEKEMISIKTAYLLAQKEIEEKSLTIRNYSKSINTLETQKHRLIQIMKKFEIPSREYLL